MQAPPSLNTALKPAEHQLGLVTALDQFTRRRGRSSAEHFSTLPLALVAPAMATLLRRPRPIFLHVLAHSTSGGWRQGRSSPDFSVRSSRVTNARLVPNRLLLIVSAGLTALPSKRMMEPSRCDAAVAVTDGHDRPGPSSAAARRSLPM